MNGRMILSLCDYTGNWPAPYREAGYEVQQIDLEHGQDVRLFRFPGRVHGILAAPPCTVFSRAGARWPRTEKDWTDALAVVDACLRLVAICHPVWWALENPAGMLRRYLGPPAFRFNPCDYGDPYTKATCLWGNFTPPVSDSLLVSTCSVEPTQGSRIHRLPGVSPRDSPATAHRKRVARSATPPGFARAFFEVNQ